MNQSISLSLFIQSCTTLGNIIVKVFHTPTTFKLFHFFFTRKLACGILQQGEPCDNNCFIYSIVFVKNLAHGSGPRKYDKRQVCFFCTQRPLKAARHYEIVHGNESEVAEIISLKAGRQNERGSWRG